MTPHARAWEAAVVLHDEHRRQLTNEQHILVLTAILRGPDAADLECIALAAQLLGTRQ